MQQLKTQDLIQGKYKNLEIYVIISNENEQCFNEKEKETQKFKFKRKFIIATKIIFVVTKN